MSLRDASQSDDHGTMLRAMREYLVDALTTCESSRDRASLAGQLLKVELEIAKLPAESKVDAVDEIAARRDARGSSPAKGAPRTKRSV